jgi:hypothetical protein
VKRQLGRPPVLIDGFVRAFWRVRTTARRATLEIELFDRVASRHRDELAEEAMRLLRFLRGSVASHAVKFTRA